MSFRRMRHVKAREFQGCDIAYDFSNPANLYDATSGGSLVAADGEIARSNDVSGNTGHMLQTTSGSRPLRKVAALNGLDAGRFDGTDDYLNAGDVGDMLANPVEAYVVFQRTGAAGTKGFFGKSLYGAAGGRWTMLSDAGKDLSTVESSSTVAGTVNQGSTSVTTLQLLCVTANRLTTTNGAFVTQRRNGAQTVLGSAFTDSGASYNTTHVVLIGAYQSSAGSTPPTGGSYTGGDFGEAAKFSVYFGEAQRRRLELSRCRKWRIKS